MSSPFYFNLKEISVLVVYIFMTRLFSLFLLAILLIPTHTSLAATDLEVGVWIPWWQDTMGTKSANDNLDNIDIIYPFVFEMTSIGLPVDKADLSEKQWRNLFDEARDKDIKIIPSIIWTDGAAMHRVLSNKTWRELHVEIIARYVESGDFDGINIDYESKLAETKEYFSLFLSELNDRLDYKLLTCTVEARMRPEHRWRQVPANTEYANDYKEMAKHCDIVELMTYDQQRADLLLNDANKGEPYIPVADVEWVESVLEFALEDFKAEKIMLGVPTYGRKWTITVAPDWYKEYSGNGAINQPDAEELAEDNDATIGENVAGEKSYTYFSPNSPFKILDVLPVSDNTRPGFEAAAKALLFANLTKMEVPVELVWYSDADAVADKVELAKEYGLKGIAIFKIDGEEDRKIWDLF